MYRGIHARASLYQKGRIGSVQNAPAAEYPRFGLTKAKEAIMRGTKKVQAYTQCLTRNRPSLPPLVRAGLKIWSAPWIAMNRMEKSSNSQTGSEAWGFRIIPDTSVPKATKNPETWQNGDAVGRGSPERDRATEANIMYHSARRRSPKIKHMISLSSLFSPKSYNRLSTTGILTCVGSAFSYDKTRTV